ncbi:MAG: transglycosylase SLT domain-containing protein [Nitrospinae bacterium]|nr:transglycosylase SLT domain-containing protein [Nitrospinota bacterium]
MKSMAKFSSLLSGIFALFLLGGLESSPNYIQGLSPYHSSLISWEDQVFDRSLRELYHHELQYENELEQQIAKVLSRYETGLKQAHLLQLPERIIEESKKYGYDPLFLTALIVTESSFYNWARSNRGALGLMQIRPATGRALARETRVKWRGKPTLYDPGTNIALGAYYLNKMVLRFGDLGLALEAYNHGPSQLTRYLKKGYRPKRYSQKVFRHYNRLRSPSA